MKKIKKDMKRIVKKSKVRGKKPIGIVAPTEPHPATILNLKAEINSLNIRLTKALDRIHELENVHSPAQEVSATPFTEFAERIAPLVKHDGSDQLFSKDRNPRRLMVPFKS